MKKLSILLLLLLPLLTTQSKAQEYVSKRPPINERHFISQAVEKKIVETAAALKNKKLAWMFANCFPNTLDTTVYPNGEGDTFVYTGDIAAMWLRDSGAQVWTYMRFINEDDELRKMIAGVILRQMRCIIIDPYANAFYKETDKVGEWASDFTKMLPGVHERKWEIDSHCYPIRLAYEYWQLSGDESIFADEWLQSIQLTIKTFREQQRKDGVGPYTFLRTTARAFDTLGNGGKGSPVKPVGLIVSSFRPSDDATVLQFLVPSNFFAVSSLRKAAEILNKVNKRNDIANECLQLAQEVEDALQE